MLNNFGRRIALSLLMIVGMASNVSAQQYNCDSRAVENALQKTVTKKYGPSAFAQIQALGEGQEVPMRMNITGMVTDGPLQGGLPGDLECTASGTFWRGDTNQTVSFTAHFWIVSDPQRGTEIAVTSVVP